jgi:hypothetical protein
VSCHCCVSRWRHTLEGSNPIQVIFNFLAPDITAYARTSHLTINLLVLFSSLLVTHSSKQSACILRYLSQTDHAIFDIFSFTYAFVGLSLG